MTDPVSTTRSTYDSIAVEFERVTRNPFSGHGDDLDAFVSMLAPGARVADVGCGPGRDAALLRERGVAVVRLDLSMAMLRLGDHSARAQVDMRVLPVRSGSLDGVWCHAALLHIPLADAPRVVAELGRVVRPAGALHLAVAEGDGEGWQTDLYDGAPRWFAHHRIEGLSVMLDQAGFVVEDVRRHSSHRDWLVVRASKQQAR